jgi:predicted phosphoribosyltransferase
MQMQFRDRRQAGQFLARKLAAYAGNPKVLILALPRGGVAVACEVAKALHAPLDVFIVRKLGVPGYEELAMGAIASGGTQVLNESIVQAMNIPREVIDQVAADEMNEVRRRERLYRGKRPSPAVRDRIVVIVDDGLATGATMRAALTVLRQQRPARIVIAVPTAPPAIYDEFNADADEVVCLITPEPFFGIGQSYRDFSQLTDDEVQELLKQTQSPEVMAAA